MGIFSTAHAPLATDRAAQAPSDLGLLEPRSCVLGGPGLGTRDPGKAHGQGRRKAGEAVKGEVGEILP